MKALNASRSCDQRWDVQCVVDSPMSYTRWDWQDSGPHQRDAEEEAKGLWVSLSMGFNSSTGLNAEASAYMMSQNKAKQEPKWGCLCIPACGKQQWHGEKRGTWEVYSSTWRPFFFQWSLPDSSPSVKTPTKWENTPQFDYLGREGVPLTNINGGKKVLNRHIKIRAGFHCTPWAAPCTWCWQSLCQQQIQLKDGAGRVFLGVWFLLLSQQLWPKLFAIKQQVTASQESLLAHTRYVLATCSGKASIPLGTSVSQAAQRAPALHGVSSLQGKLGVLGQHPPDWSLPAWEMARGLKSGAAVHLCLLPRPPLSAQAFHPSVKKDVSYFSGMLKPWQLGWSSSSGWRADVQRPGQTAPMHVQLSSPARTPWVSPVSDVLRFTLFMHVVIVANELWLCIVLPHPCMPQCMWPSLWSAFGIWEWALLYSVLLHGDFAPGWSKGTCCRWKALSLCFLYQKCLQHLGTALKRRVHSHAPHMLCIQPLWFSSSLHDTLLRVAWMLLSDGDRSQEGSSQTKICKPCNHHYSFFSPSSIKRQCSPAHPLCFYLLHLVLLQSFSCPSFCSWMLMEQAPLQPQAPGPVQERGQTPRAGTRQLPELLLGKWERFF